MTKIARKLTPNFLPILSCENYHKILQKYQEIYMNFLGIFQRFFGLKCARKLLILTKIKEKMLQIFSTGFSTKNTTKMLKKISRTHEKWFRNFLKDFRQGSGVNSKIQWCT
jgi:hypothetical protein